MNKVLRYMAGVIGLLALGAGVAWYARSMRKQDALVQREGDDWMAAAALTVRK